MKENGKHGDTFVVEVKKNKTTAYHKKMTRSKKVSLKSKLEQAKQHLKQLSLKNPELFDTKNLHGQLTPEGEILKKEYYELMNLLQRPIYAEELVKNDIREHSRKLLEKQAVVQKDSFILQDREDSSGYSRMNILPENCGVSMDELPKYVYYQKETENRGDCFVIDGHPKLIELGKRQKSSTSSKKKTTKQKFEVIKMYLRQLEDGNLEFRKKKNSPPAELGIDEFPKYLRYVKETDKCGAYFVVKHPSMNGKQKCSTKVKSKSLVEKYEQALEILNSCS